MKTNMKDLDPALRAELDALLAAPTEAFISTYDEVGGFWLLGIIACVSGAGAAVWNLSTELPIGELIELVVVEPRAMLRPTMLGLPFALVLGAFLTFKAVSQRGRRGYAALSTAILAVKGSKLEVFPYAGIASTDRHTAGKRGARFTVFKLTFKDGRTKELLVSGRWADVVVSRL